ncbi:MAG: PAS domain S-box protein [bacterium]
MPVTSTTAAQDAEQLFGAVLDQFPIGIAYANREGRFVRFNTAYSSMLGYSAHDLLRISLDQLTHAEDANARDSDYQRLWRGDTNTYERQRRYIKKDGTAVWVKVTATLLRDGDGSPTFALGLVQDITARKVAELSLERFNRELAVASRRAAMAEIASHVIHNIGNALTSVVVSIDVLARNLRKFPGAGLKRAATLLIENATSLGPFFTDHEHGRHIPAFLSQAADSAVHRGALVKAEVASLQQHIDRIRDTLNECRTHLNPIDSAGKER